MEVYWLPGKSNLASCERSEEEGRARRARNAGLTRAIMQNNENRMMIAGIKKIRGYIRGELRAKGEASLVFIIAKFDFSEHAIPSLDELNQALSGFTAEAIRTDSDIVIRENTSSGIRVTITNDDLGFLYQTYSRKMRQG